MNFAFLEKIVINYLEAHPELIERLITDLFGKLLSSLEEKLHTPAPAPKA